MNETNNNNKNLLSVINQIYFFILIINTAASTEFVRSPAGHLTLLGITLFVMLLNAIRLSKSLMICFAVWIIYFVCSSLSIGSFHPYFFIEIPIILLCAYTAIQIFQKDCFELFVKYVYVLSAFALLFYTVQILFPQYAIPLFESINIQGGFLTETNSYNGSFIIYSYSHNPSIFLDRNCGFAWEPGAYSFFCLLALFVNMIICKRRSTENYVFLINLLTTRSTTGYCLLFVLGFFILFNAKNSIKYFLYIPLVIICFIMWKFDFVGEKFMHQLNSSNIDSVENYIDLSIQYNTSYRLGRFDSFLLAMKDFIKRPLLGYGGNTSLQYAFLQGANVSVISGIGIFLARYGIFCFIVWLYIVYQSSRYLASYREENLKKSIVFLWFVLNIGIAISYSQFLSPVFFIFYLFPFFCPKNNTDIVSDCDNDFEINHSESNPSSIMRIPT